jgi:hypothetical protein
MKYRGEIGTVWIFLSTVWSKHRPIVTTPVEIVCMPELFYNCEWSVFYNYILPWQYGCFESCQFWPRSVFFLSWRLNKSAGDFRCLRYYLSIKLFYLYQRLQCRDKYFFKIKFVFFLYLRLSASSKENDLPLCIYFWYQKILTEWKWFEISVLSLNLGKMSCGGGLNATYNNISVISWRSVVLVDKNWVPGENHRPIA